MMSANHWLLLWLIFLSYLFLGAFLFYSIERRYEEHRRVDEKPEKMAIEDLLNTYYSWTNNRAHKQLLLRLKRRCNITLVEPILHLDDIVEVEDEFQWTFYNSFFFSLTTLSTIGYGNLHPTSCLGRMVVIVYSLLGIPLNGIVLTQLGEFFASTFLRAHERYKERRFETRFGLLIAITSYLIPGILLFIFLPSSFFVYFEGWTFEQSIYFAYVTLTTIGYGDFVAGQSITDNLWYNIYKVVLILWIIFGLGYLVMILGFISRAMRSKKIARLERNLTQNLKQTHSKILNGLNRDVSYVRRLLNELYLLKFKPVYQDEKEEDVPLERRRTHSCPNLTKWPVLEKVTRPVIYSDSDDEEITQMQFEKYKMKRRKALSENVFKRRDIKTRSETDLTKIDKDATFNNVAYLERNELMARVANAFNNTYTQMQQAQHDYGDYDDEIPPRRKVSQFEKELLELDVDIFSNDDLLSSERAANWDRQWSWPASESNDEKLPNPKCRDIPNQWEKRRSIPLLGVQSLRRVSMAALNFFTPSRFSRTSREDENRDLELGEEQQQKAKRYRRSTGKIVCTSKKRYSLADDYDNVYECLNYFTQIQMEEASILSTLKNQIGNLAASNPVLEKTSIGDFLRIENSLTPEAKKAEPNPSLLFALFQNDLNKHSTSRRSSLIPAKEDASGGGGGGGSGGGAGRRRRRFSLVPAEAAAAAATTTITGSMTRHQSFSTCSPTSASSKFARLELPRVCRIRSEYLPNLPNEDCYGVQQPSTSKGPRQIRRFFVKPVTLPASTPPQIVISPSSPDHNERRRRRKANEDEHDETSRL